eukprot:TRINITY_DN20215_c0_g1_i3.p1 TRINITY_DN20215_c0_g1~~TRINITY_DN20215_c0_g1_i3.p1  ORF type:complete len:478 (+),score=88.65 TRINITY_DN20215_c0_g1_i3:99-1532(+)
MGADGLNLLGGFQGGSLSHGTRIAPDGSVLTKRQFLKRYCTHYFWNHAPRERKPGMRIECGTPRMGMQHHLTMRCKIPPVPRESSVQDSCDTTQCRPECATDCRASSDDFRTPPRVPDGASHSPVNSASRDSMTLEMTSLNGSLSPALARTPPPELLVAQVHALSRAADRSTEAKLVAVEHKLLAAEDALRRERAARLELEAALTHERGQRQAEATAAAEKSLREVEHLRRELELAEEELRGYSDRMREAQQAQYRATSAELKLLPHWEITERGRTEMAESEARRVLTCSGRFKETPAADGKYPNDVTLVSDRQLGQCATGAAARGTHPDSGWFLTLGVVSLSVGAFAPEQWAPVCSDAAVSAVGVHRFWFNSARLVHIDMLTALGQRRAAPGPSEFLEALRQWRALEGQVWASSTGFDISDEEKLLLRHINAVSNILGWLEVVYTEHMYALDSMMKRLRSSRNEVIDIIGVDRLFA